MFFGRICFTLVSEPPEDQQDADCEDVGMAFVSILDILRNRKDVIEDDVDSEYSVCVSDVQSHYENLPMQYRQNFDGWIYAVPESLSE